MTSHLAGTTKKQKYTVNIRHMTSYLAGTTKKQKYIVNIGHMIFFEFK
jgi:hypothetical protein